MSYVIIKSSRIYHGGTGYTGITCMNAGVEPGKIYDDKESAQRAVDLLTEHNGVGFTIEEFKQNNPPLQRRY